jgi:hypothetical protein
MNIRRLSCRSAFTVTVLALFAGLAGTTAQADETSEASAGLPDGVVRTAESLYNPSTNEKITRGIVPGTRFYYGYSLVNQTDSPMVLTGFTSEVKTRVHPDRPEPVEPDYCDKFIVQLDTVERQNYPHVIEPGQTAGPFFDNATFEFLYAADNACQRMSMQMGTPQVQQDRDPTGPDLPSEGSATSSLTGSIFGSLGSLTQ